MEGTHKDNDVGESADAKARGGPSATDPAAKPRDTRAVLALRLGGRYHSRPDKYGTRSSSQRRP